MSSPRPRLSIIVPIGSSEVSWSALFPQLEQLAVSHEIILAASLEDARADDEFRKAIARPIVICRTLQGRGAQMNAAAKLSRGELLWFLHADSELSKPLIEQINSGLIGIEQGLYYFNLKYQKDGPSLCALNAWAANLRSNVFGLPFGDQGFLIERELFIQLGGYSTSCKYGEDHLFVWKVHRSGKPVRSLGSALHSSARKYRDSGWASVTLNHSVLFITQLVRECLPKGLEHEH